MSSLWSLPPPDRASFATAARLISCLVTESLLKATYLPIHRTTPPHPPHHHSNPLLTGIALILAPRIAHNDAPHAPEHVFAVVPLRSPPVLAHASPSEIALLDPLDMLPAIYHLPDHPTLHSKPPQDALGAATLAALVRAGLVPSDAPASLAPIPDALFLWHRYAHALDVDDDMIDAVAAELSSSLLWQQYAYEHPPPAPTFDSPSIAWEQAIVEGHPTHPMHKARRTISPTPPIQPGDFDWYHPRIHLVAVPRASLNVQGPWEDLVRPLAPAALELPRDHLLVPVHELQLENIRVKFPEARVFPVEHALEAQAQQSLRSVLIPQALPAHSLKLAFGVRLTSAMRTISPPSALLGPRFSAAVVPKLTYDRALLVVQRELASVSHVHKDPDVAKHLAAIVRESYESTAADGDGDGERVIVCTALTEMGHDPAGRERPLVEIVFGLDTEAKRLAWLDSFIDTYLRAFLPPVLANGVAFEAHPQNTLARFSRRSGTLTGFLIRDFGGLRIHAASVLASTGVPAAAYVAPGHSVLADTLEDVYTRLYHTVVHNHVQQLVRALRLHYSGKGWAVLRRQLRRHLPEGHALARLWLGEETRTLPGKCFMRMRLQGMYRTHLHGPFPNLIHYEGVREEDDNEEK